MYSISMLDLWYAYYVCSRFIPQPLVELKGNAYNIVLSIAGVWLLLLMLVI